MGLLVALHHFAESGGVQVGKGAPGSLLGSDLLLSKGGLLALPTLHQSPISPISLRLR